MMFFARDTIYTGEKEPDNWPELQLDRPGTWLWALNAFHKRGLPLNEEMIQAARLTADYLTMLWPCPCHDLWEEFGAQVHTSTLAAIYAGLCSSADLLGSAEYRQIALQIKSFIFDKCIQSNGLFRKFVGDERVDASLATLAMPYGLVSPDDPVLRSTVRRIEEDLLVPDVGVHRYIGDTYYGGGAWLLLHACLGWHYLVIGEREKVDAVLSSLRRRVVGAGDLPEQLAPPMLAEPSYYDHWVQVRGPIATPLLWSHAMYLILSVEAGI